MKKSIFVLFLLLTARINHAGAQVENMIIITTDGLRWQEVFEGMNDSIAKDKRFVKQRDSANVFQQYWHQSTAERRKLLLPFFWNVIAAKGQIYGNRNYGNKVDVANPYWFSYPGYNEILTGYPDKAINSNSYQPNPNITLLEFLNAQSAFKNKVAAFTAWEAFDRIINKHRCGFPVASAVDTAVFKNPSVKQVLINQMLLNAYSPWGKDECLDVFTHYAAMEYLKTQHPKVLYIAYGETDEWAHAGQYKEYLNAAGQVDKWIGEIWNYVQTDPKYKNKTLLFITTDHGRGIGDKWTDHGSSTPHSSEEWFAVLGAGVPAKGEMKQPGQYYADQYAQTIASLLGLTFKAAHPIGNKINIR